jgi:putative Holliday junction resolvase
LRILSVDPGEKQIGIALSDPTGTCASPLPVIRHVARGVDAALVAGLAREHGAEKIVVGQALDSEGNPGPAARKAQRFAEALAEQTDIPIELWDESGSTQSAREIRLRSGVKRSQRGGHLDAVAAAVILQDYLDAHHE